MILADVINCIQMFLRQSNNVIFQESLQNFSGFGTFRQNTNNAIVRKVVIKVTCRILCFCYSWQNLCSSFLFAQKSWLDSLFQAPGNSKKFTCYLNANLHLQSQRTDPLSLKSQKEFFAFLPHGKDSKKSRTFSFNISSSSSSAMLFHRSYEILAKKFLALLGVISLPRNHTRQLHCFDSAAKRAPMQLSLNFIFTIKSRAFACLSFTMMPLQEWLESSEKIQYYSILHYIPKQ